MWGNFGKITGQLSSIRQRASELARDAIRDLKDAGNSDNVYHSIFYSTIA